MPSGPGRSVSPPWTRRLLPQGSVRRRCAPPGTQRRSLGPEHQVGLRGRQGLGHRVQHRRRVAGLVRINKLPNRCESQRRARVAGPAQMDRFRAQGRGQTFLITADEGDLAGRQHQKRKRVTPPGSVPRVTTAARGSMR